eukprot:624180-Rhodomonas_salina.1
MVFGSSWAVWYSHRIWRAIDLSQAHLTISKELEALAQPRDVRVCSPIFLRAPYAMSGTDIAQTPLSPYTRPMPSPDTLLPPQPPNPIPVPNFDPALPAGNVISIEVSEEAVSDASCPVLSQCVVLRDVRYSDVA